MDNGSREIVLITGGVISALFSGSVVLTGIVFSKTMLSRTHPFSNMIFFISLCDMLGSIAMSLGYPDSDECKVQSFFLLFFFPASWLWTTCLVYQLRSMMFYKKLHLSMFTLHCICWSVSLLVALLPLSQNQYGEDDDLEDRSVCYLASTDKHRKFWWLFGLYFGVLLVCVLLMLVWLISSYRLATAMRTTTFTDHKERQIYQATRWYPRGLLMTWVMSIAVTFMLAIYSDARVDYIQAGQIAQTQYGTVLALIFFGNSKIVRHRWKELYKKVFRLVLSNHSTSSDTLPLDRESEDDLDPEGVKFSTDASITEGPRLSELAHILSFGVLASSSSSSSRQRGAGNSNDSNDSGDSGDGTERNASSSMRVSMYVRDWLVSSSRARASNLEMGAHNGGGRSTSNDSNGSSSSGGLSGPKPSSPRNNMNNNNNTSTTPAGAEQAITSPLAAALERARGDRDRDRAAADKSASVTLSGGTGSGSGGSVGSGIAVGSTGEGPVGKEVVLVQHTEV